MEKLFGQKGRNSRAFLGDARIYIPRIYDCQRIKIHVLLVENERNSVIRHSLWTARGGGLAHWGGAPGGSPRGRARTRRSRSRWTGAGPPPQPNPSPTPSQTPAPGGAGGVGLGWLWTVGRGSLRVSLTVLVCLGRWDWDRGWKQRCRLESGWIGNGVVAGAVYAGMVPISGGVRRVGAGWVCPSGGDRDGARQ